MMKVTLLKPYRQQETLRPLELTDIVELIRGAEYRHVVDEFRRLYPVFDLTRQPDGSVTGAHMTIGKLPRICFASEMENRNHQRVTLGYTGLVLLEVNNLTGYDEAEAIRAGAGEVPQTLMAFVGASGRSVKIICRGELFPGDSQSRIPAPPLPLAPDKIQDFHENLYERARLA